MESERWVCGFAKLNELNTKLQGKGVIAHELYLEVKAFQLKRILFAKQVNELNFVHFPLLKTRAVTQGLSGKYSSQLMALKKEFFKRFADIKEIEGQFDLLSSLLPVTLKHRDCFISMHALVTELLTCYDLWGSIVTVN